MDDFHAAEERAFVSEEIEGIVVNCIEGLLKDKTYQEECVSQWVDTLLESAMASISGLQKPFKYVLSAMIMQKNGAGVHSAANCYWDTLSDGVVTVKWPIDKRKDGTKDIYCIVNVFGFSV